MAELKTISSIKFFLKNPETTAAFSKDITPFSSTYPNDTFNNVTSTINLIDLSNKYEIKSPTYIGTGTFNTTRLAVTDVNEDQMFITSNPGDLLLSGLSVDELLIIGTIKSIANDNNSVLLETYPNISAGLSTEDYGDIYVFSKYNEAKSFNFNDSFYMVIKNPDIVGTKHEGIVNINVSNNGPSSLVFAYGNNKIANPSFLSLKKISTTGKYSEGLNSTEITNEENIQCFINGISTLSEQLSTVINEISDAQIPRWSVYEVNPYGNSISNFSKNTTYKLTVCNSSSELPMIAITQDSVIPPEA